MLLSDSLLCTIFCQLSKNQDIHIIIHDTLSQQIQYLFARHIVTVCNYATMLIMVPFSFIHMLTSYHGKKAANGDTVDSYYPVHYSNKRYQ